MDDRYACRAVVVQGMVESDDEEEEVDKEEEEGARVLAWSCGDEEGGEGVGE